MELIKENWVVIPASELVGWRGKKDILVFGQWAGGRSSRYSIERVEQEIEEEGRPAWPRGGIEGPGGWRSWKYIDVVVAGSGREIEPYVRILDRLVGRKSCRAIENERESYVGSSQPPGAWGWTKTKWHEICPVGYYLHKNKPRRQHFDKFLQLESEEGFRAALENANLDFGPSVVAFAAWNVLALTGNPDAELIENRGEDETHSAGPEYSYHGTKELVLHLPSDERVWERMRVIQRYMSADGVSIDRQKVRYYHSW